MAMSKKRSFNDSNNRNYHPTEEPPTKKQKLEEFSSTIQSKLFTNICDNKQFQTIFHSIDNSPLIKQFNIPHIISKGIAEYSTGNIKHCANNDCKTEIFILNEYIQKYKSNHGNSAEIGFKYCYHTNEYYCQKCMEYAIMLNGCKCNQWNQIYWPSNLDKCGNITCDGIISDCQCLQGHQPEPCGDECDKGNVEQICYDCYQNDNYEKTRVCIECYQVFCDDCIAYSEYDDSICKTCERSTSVECAGNCGLKINTLCHNKFIYWDDMTYIQGCEVCDIKYCEWCHYVGYYCIGCNMPTCEKCSKSNGRVGVNKDNEKYVCNECFKDTIITCTKCNIEYQLLCETNSNLMSLDGKYEMEKCKLSSV
eukprot:94134_1